MYAPSLWLIGSPRPLRSRRFLRKQRVRPGAVRRLLSQTVSSSRELSRLSRVLQSLSALSARAVKAPSLGLRWDSLFATSVGVNHAVVSRSTALRPRRFPRPRRFSCRRPRGFISPHCHVQGSPSGACSSSEAVVSRRHPLPSRRWRRVAAVGCPPAPRPVTSSSGPCSSLESVVFTAVV